MTRIRRRRVVILVLELALVCVVIWSIYAWRTRPLLAADGLTEAPPFTLRDLDGQMRSLSDYRGRPTVLYFFAPWCTVCKASAHQLRWFDRLFGDEVNVVMVALEFTGADAVVAFLDEHRLENVILLGDTEVARAYRVPGFPTYYVLDADGLITRRDFGLTTIAGLWMRTCLASL